MPRIRYLCENEGCKNEIFVFIANSGSIVSKIICPKCNLFAKRQLSAPASKSVITVDNGAQARAVEVDLNVIESNKERSQKGDNRGD